LNQSKEAFQLYEDLLPAVRGTSWEGIVFVRRAVVLRSGRPEIPQSSPLSTFPFSK
jgi:hypothetical protein